LKEKTEKPTNIEKPLNRVMQKPNVTWHICMRMAMEPLKIIMKPLNGTGKLQNKETQMRKRHFYVLVGGKGRTKPID
jgi:hypothetical protein